MYLDLCSNLSPKKALQPMCDTLQSPVRAQGPPLQQSPFTANPPLRPTTHANPFVSPSHAQNALPAWAFARDSPTTLYPYSPTKSSTKRMAAGDDDGQRGEEEEEEDQGMDTEPEDNQDENGEEFDTVFGLLPSAGAMDVDGCPASPTRPQRPHKGLPKRSTCNIPPTSAGQVALGLSSRPLAGPGAPPKRNGLQKTQSLPPSAFSSSIDF